MAGGGHGNVGGLSGSGTPAAEGPCAAGAGDHTLREGRHPHREQGGAGAEPIAGVRLRAQDGAHSTSSSSLSSSKQPSSSAYGVVELRCTYISAIYFGKDWTLIG